MSAPPRSRGFCETPAAAGNGVAGDIGRELILARQIGTPWKLLERQYGYGRTRLWMLYRAALGGSDVHEHLGACEDAPGEEGSLPATAGAKP